MGGHEQCSVPRKPIVSTCESESVRSGLTGSLQKSSSKHDKWYKTGNVDCFGCESTPYTTLLFLTFFLDKKCLRHILRGPYARQSFRLFLPLLTLTCLDSFDKALASYLLSTKGCQVSYIQFLLFFTGLTAIHLTNFLHLTHTFKNSISSPH